MTYRDIVYHVRDQVAGISIAFLETRPADVSQWRRRHTVREGA